MVKLKQRVKDMILGVVGVVTGRAEFTHMSPMVQIDRVVDGKVERLWLEEGRLIPVGDGLVGKTATSASTKALPPKPGRKLVGPLRRLAVDTLLAEGRPMNAGQLTKVMLMRHSSSIRRLTRQTNLMVAVRQAMHDAYSHPSLPTEHRLVRNRGVFSISRSS
jgi:hypothetical protein